MKRFLLMIVFLFLLTSLQAQDEDKVKGVWTLRMMYEVLENGDEKKLIKDFSFLKASGLMLFNFFGEGGKSGLYTESKEGSDGYKMSSRFSYQLKGNKIRIKAHEEGESFFLLKNNNRVLEVKLPGGAWTGKEKSMSLIAKEDGKTIRYLLQKN